MRAAVAMLIVTVCVDAIVLAACAPTPEGVARFKLQQQAYDERTFLPGSPNPGEPGYNRYACGGDHGLAQERIEDIGGYPRIGPPQSSICR